jgi:hypothetical protein
MRTLSLLLVLGLPLAAPAGARTAAPCPDSHGQLVGFNNLFAVSSATFDSTYLLSEVAFDLPAGTLRMSRGVGGVNWTRSIATDAYDLAGVAPGTVVTLTAALDVNGYVTSPGCGGSGCGGYFQASITEGANSSQQQVTFPNPFAGGQVDMVQTLTLPLTITAGTPVTVAFELAVFVPAGGNAGGAGSGVIHFDGLPEGVQVVSCRGFGASTPARATSWGTLKVRYR